MINETKKKTNDKKQTTIEIKDKEIQKKPSKRGTVSKLNIEKEIKIEEDLNEGISTNTTGSNSTTAKTNIIANTGSTKYKKVSEANSLSTTPKSGVKLALYNPDPKYTAKLITNKSRASDKKLTLTNNKPSNDRLNPNTFINTVSPNSNSMTQSPNNISNKKLTMNFSHNPNHIKIINSLETYINNDIKLSLTSAFTKIQSISNTEFFVKFHKIKKDMNELLSMTINESNPPPNTATDLYYSQLIRFLDNTANTINNRLRLVSSQNNNNNNETINIEGEENWKSGNLNLSILSDDGLIDYFYIKNNAVSFEVPIKRQRAMSENDEKSEDSKKYSKIEQRLSNRKRMSSEEVEKRMREKLETVEKNKNVIKNQHKDSLDKLMGKIKSIKSKRKIEKQEKMQKLSEKLERFNMRHQKYLSEKVSKAKEEHAKVAEINFLHRMEKENRDINLIRKLDISIDRRQKHIMQRLSKTIQRNLKDEEVEKKRKVNEDENRNKILRKMQKKMENKDSDNKLPIFKTDDKLELVTKRKHNLENQIEFLKNVYSENFIWELLEADYFDINDLCEISNITKFEIIKAKLRKDRDKIDKLFENNKNKSKTKISNKTSSHNDDTLTQMNYEDKDELYLDHNESDKDSTGDLDIPKKARSFTIFDENDLMEVDYLFKDTQQKKKKRKKKKKPEVIKKKLIRTINSMSQKDLTSFFTKMNTDKKMKKFLVKSKNGRYIKSKIMVGNEEFKINTSPSNLKTNPGNNNPLSSINSNSNWNTNTNTNPNNMIEFDKNTQNNVLTDGDLSNDEEISFLEEKKEKIIKNIVQNSDILMRNENNTIIINSESLSNLLEKNAITLPNDQDPNIHISKQEHKKLKGEYGISLQDDSNLIMIFQSLPGDISEDLKNERTNAIKIRFKKIKQKLSLRAVKHENFWSYKQDFPSANKQRIQKLSFDIEKQYQNIKDYEGLEANLKDLIKILEQKKQNDLHIMRQSKIVNCVVEILKKPGVCHKSEIKNLGKIIELVIKILMYFSTIIENRNYMVVTNRMSVIADLLLWVLNKPSKIPLGISFLPDLIYIITIHIKHRIPFEYLSMKDDFLEYLFLSNILVKFRQKYTTMVGPIDLTSGFGSFPLVLLKSMGMIEALTSQININYCSKPVYVRTNKISDNILFLLEYTELIGIVQLLSTLLLSNGPIKPKSDKDNSKTPVLPLTIISASVLGVKILNNIARLDLIMFQSVFANSLVQDQIYHVFNYIISYSMEYIDNCDDIKELLHETVLLMNYVTLMNEKLQTLLSRGEITIVQRICSLPFSYFCEKKLKDILFPTLISISYKHDRNMDILNKELNLEMIVMFLKEKIQLEPIIEEEEMDKLDESRDEINFNLISINKDQFTSFPKMTIGGTNDLGLKKRTMSFSSSASSTKSCHDMITGVSDYVLFYHRFPRNLWEKALDYYSSFGK